MVLDWVDHPSLKQTDILINVLYDLGMAQSKHIEAATGWDYKQVKQVLYRIRRNLKKSGEDEQDWIKTVHMRLHEPVVYYLSPKFMYQAEQLRESRTIRSVRGLSSMQCSHYIGINNIFVNAIKHFGRSHLKWYSEYEATELISLELTEEHNKILRPDAKMRVGKKALFIEFDNSTEGPSKLDLKFKRYIDYTKKTGDLTPVLWVTTTETRKEYLKRNWQASIKGSSHIPNAYFCVAGDEIKVFQYMGSVVF